MALLKTGPLDKVVHNIYQQKDNKNADALRNSEGTLFALQQTPYNQETKQLRNSKQVSFYQ